MINCIQFTAIVDSLTTFSTNYSGARVTREIHLTQNYFNYTRGKKFIVSRFAISSNLPVFLVPNLWMLLISQLSG
jgi:hypothetical protein